MTNKNHKESVNRRTFMKAATAAAFTAPSLFYPSNALGQAQRGTPNIIFIHIDQMSLLDSVAAYGAEYTSTPSIDRIVRNGTSFMQSYATDPVCCPARSSWWTGTYPSENGIVVNNTPCHKDIPDLSRLLQQAGYNTYYAGKWHVPGKNVRELFHVIHEGSWWGELTDHEVTRSGRAFLRNYNDKKPFFLSLGYLNPHDICITPSIDYVRAHTKNGKKYPCYTETGILSDKDLPPLPTAHGYDRREPTIQIARHRVNIDKPKFSEWSEDLWRMHRYNYHRLVEMVDAEIGLMLDELEQSKWRDNTLLIFCTDHGDGMGRHHGLGKSTFYEEAVKVPFIVATLGDVLRVRKDVQNTTHIVSGIDFGKTVCDYASADGAKLPHGRSLRPLVEQGKADDWREYVYAENSVYMHMISDGRFKYVRSYEENEQFTGMPPSTKTHQVGVEQLFDLQQDPDEQQNLAYNKQSQTLLKKLRSVMDKKEAARMPLRPVPHEVGLNWMKRQAEIIRNRNYPRTYQIS